MNAAIIKHYKQDLPTIEQVPIPKIGANDVLIKIVTASINPIDLKTKDDGLKMLLKYEMPLILGSDFSGIITEVGSAIINFSFVKLS